jgi:uncharacterized protein
MRAFSILSMLVLVGVLSACASTRTQNHYYTLVEQTPEPSLEHLKKPRLSLVLQPIKLPVQVDRTQIVLRLDEQRVQLLETHRWSQPLKYEISQAVSAHLSHALPNFQVYASGRQLKAQPDIVIALEILQFDSVQGTSASVEARWSIQSQAEQTPINGHTLVEVPVTSDALASLAEAHVEAMREISRQIASGIQPALQGAELAKP